VTTTFEVLHETPAWLSGLGFLATLLLAAEVGYRAGRRTARRRGKAAEGLATVEGAVFGLLGLLLAFTYAFVTARADARKQAVIQEANAIGTAYLRAGLVPDPVRTELRALLREYVETRIVTDASGRDPAKLREVIAASERVQARIWPTAARLLDGRSPTILDSLLFQSLNEVIDLHTVRLAAGRDRLPGAILLMLILTGVISLGVAGRDAGMSGRRRGFQAMTLALLVAAVTTVILDLDQPGRGLVRVSQQSLAELRRSIEPGDAP
jgi:hypothetical protein